MRFRKQLTIVTLALALAPTSASSQSPRWTSAAANEGMLAPWDAIDLTLDWSPEGRRESAPFELNGHSYRLYVRDTGIVTSRGAHDRVCVASATDPNADLPILAISMTSAGPDGIRPVRSDDVRRRVRCDLLPEADAYRVWSRRHPRAAASVPEFSPWRAPAVFADFEPMTDQDDQNRVIGRNIERLLQSLELDGVCVEISVLRGPFSSPQGALDWQMWFDALQGVSYGMRQQLGLKSNYLTPEDPGYVQPRRGVIYSRLSPVGAGLRQFSNVLELPRSNAYAHLHTVGFLQTEDAEIYLSEIPLDPEQLPVQLIQAYCFGDPIVYQASRSHRPADVYAFARISVVAPYWIEYPEGYPEAQRYWERFNDYVMRHELVHVYDFLSVINQATFRARGDLAFRSQLTEARARPVDLYHYGFSPGWNNDISGRGSLGGFFQDYIEDVIMGGRAAAGYFHNAIYAVNASGERTASLDIDQLTPMDSLDAGHGDRDARLRAYIDVVQRWVEPAGAGN
jgi:hypothetical protein